VKVFFALAYSADLRQPVSKIESLTQLLESVCAKANAVKNSDPAQYEQRVADVREVLRQLSEVVANEWSKVLSPSDQLN
jgi:archaellum component FlaC